MREKTLLYLLFFVSSLCAAGGLFLLLVGFFSLSRPSFPGLNQEFMLTLTSLFELEVDDIISGMPGGAFAANVFAVRRDHNHWLLQAGHHVRHSLSLSSLLNLQWA